MPGEAGQIARHLAEDVVEVESSRRFFDDKDFARLPLFGKVIDGPVPGQKITFDSKDQVGYYINSYIPVGKDLFILNFTSVMHQDYDIEDFNSIARHLRLRADDEIPTEPGTCINGGFLPIALDYERVTIGVRLKEFPDVHLSVDVHKNQDSLYEGGRLELMLKDGEATAKQNGQGAIYARIKTLRRGPRQLGPWKGYEMVARKPAYKDDTEAHEFRFQSLGAVNDALHPQIDIRLDSGVKDNQTARAKPSITDEEAIALWDRLIGTIRVRQSNDAQPSKAAPPQVPLGKLTATGDVCTQQGWWHCTEGGPIEGGRRRHFTVGESMPSVILQGRPSFWQKLTGDLPRHSIATVWQLLEYDVAPAAASLADDSANSPVSIVAQKTLLPTADSSMDQPARKN